MSGKRATNLKGERLTVLSRGENTVSAARRGRRLSFATQFKASVPTVTGVYPIGNLLERGKATGEQIKAANRKVETLTFG